jgi:hypothetical protein
LAGFQAAMKSTDTGTIYRPQFTATLRLVCRINSAPINKIAITAQQQLLPLAASLGVRIKSDID